MSEKKNVYLQVADAITAERKAWCKGAWELPDPKSPTSVMSRCLVDHIDAVTGVYKVVGFRKVSSNTLEPGADFYEGVEGALVPIVKKSRDKRKWAKRNKMLAQLATVLPENRRRPTGYFDEEGAPLTYGFESDPDRTEFGRIMTPAAYDLVDYNDQASMTRAGVLKLLRRAAAKYPNA